MYPTDNKAGERLHPIPNIEFPKDFIYSIEEAHNDRPCWAILVVPPAILPKTRSLIPSFVFLCLL